MPFSRDDSLTANVIGTNDSSGQSLFSVCQLNLCLYSAFVCIESVKPKASCECVECNEIIRMVVQMQPLKANTGTKELSIRHCYVSQFAIIYVNVLGKCVC